MTAQSTQPTHQEMRQKKARWVVLTVGALVLAREHWWRSVSMSGFARRRVSHILRSGEHRAFGAPMNGNCTLWTLRVAWLKALSLLRFFVALCLDRGHSLQVCGDMVDTFGQSNCLESTMPWNPRDTMKLRQEFVELALHQSVPFTELCRRFGISRQTGYKWLN